MPYIYTSIFFGKFCTVYTFDRHYTFNKNLNYFLIFTKFYKIVIKNWNNGMENWSGTYFIHFSSKKSLKSSLYTNISLWKIPPYMFIRIVSALYVYNFTRISKTLRLLGSIRQLGTLTRLFKNRKCPEAKNSLGWCLVMILPNLSHFKSLTKRCLALRNRPFRPFCDSQHQTEFFLNAQHLFLSESKWLKFGTSITE